MGKIAFRLAELIGDLDERVFGEKNAAGIVIIAGRPNTIMNNAYIGYVPYQNRSLSKSTSIEIGNFYTIFKKLPKLLEGKGSARLKFYNNSITVNAFIIAIVAHEVRHRVQYTLPISLISLEDELRVKSFVLQTLIRSNNKIYTQFKKDHKKDQYAREFDALIIGLWAAKIWHETKDISKVARLVKTDANDFRKRGKKQSSPLIFSTFLISTWFQNCLSAFNFQWLFLEPIPLGLDCPVRNARKPIFLAYRDRLLVPPWRVQGGPILAI